MLERLSTEQRTKVVQFYFESQHSIIQTKRSYRHFFMFEMHPVLQFGNKGLSVIFRVLEDLVQFEMM